MKNNLILQQAKEIAHQSESAPLEQKGKYLEQAEEFLLSYLRDNPQDTEAWLMLTMIEWTPPLEDFERIIQWTKNILAYDPTNALALLVFAEAHWFFGGINEVGYEMLCNAKSNDRHLMAMIEVAKAKYLEDKPNRQDEYEKVLKNSIAYGPEQVMNHEMLGDFYIKHDKKKYGKSLIKKSKENQEKYKMLSRSIKDDLTDVMDFCNMFYAGLYG